MMYRCDPAALIRSNHGAPNLAATAARTYPLCRLSHRAQSAEATRRGSPKAIYRPNSSNEAFGPTGAKASCMHAPDPWRLWLTWCEQVDTQNRYAHSDNFGIDPIFSTNYATV